MRTISEILQERAEALSETYLSAIRSQSREAARSLPVDEVMHVAAKLKRLYFNQTGISQMIASDASAYYEEQLKKIDRGLHLGYVQSKQPNASDDLKAAVFAALARVYPDTPIKTRYIEEKLALDPASDQAFVIQAARQVAYRRAKEQIASLEKHFTKLASRSAFEPFLNLFRYIEESSVATLFQKELIQTIAAGYGGQEIKAMFYKCLRLTHEYGRVSFYAGLDDHNGFDRDGHRVTFSGDADVYQLNVIRDILRGFLHFGISPRGVVIVCDFDLYKFAHYEVPRPQLLTYFNQVQEYFRDANVDVRLQTEYFGGDTFQAVLADVMSSIIRGDERFVRHAEFKRIEQAYFDHYSKSMENWTAAVNEYYSIRSVARNIAEGMELAPANAIVFLFNESLVNGERFNLKTSKKVPFVGLRKAALEDAAPKDWA